MLIKIAFRNIFRQKSRSLISAISMMGGYTLMSLALSVSDGSYSNMIDLFTRDHTGHIQIHQADFLAKPKIHKAIRNYEAIQSKLVSIDNIRSFAPRIFAPALAYGESKSLPVELVGILPEKEKTTSLLFEKVKQGQFLSIQREHTPNKMPQVMIGTGIAKTLKLKVDDTLVLISQGADGSIANDIFKISAIVGNDSSWEKNRAFITISDAQEFLSLYGAIHQICILLDHPNQSRKTSEKLQTLLAQAPHPSQLPIQPSTLSQSRLHISPWQEVEEVFYKSMRTDVIGNYITQGIIIFIVCIGILNTVFMSIVERTREFGVLMAIGTSPSILFKMILLETGILATISCLAGLAIALPMNYWLATQGIEMDLEIDIGGITYNRLLGEVSFHTLILPAIVVITSAVFVSIFPAIRAARMVPIKAIRAN